MAADQFVFEDATKEEARLRLTLNGPPGSGKTFTALKIAQTFPGPLFVIDTEHGSASKYAHLFKFKRLNLTDDFSPERYVAAIRAAEAAGAGTLIIDSLSHAWSGKGGALELVDRFGQQRGGKFQGGWGKVTPMQNAMIEAMLGSRMHIIVTMRTKMQHEVQNLPNGGTKVVKLGMAPIQREGVEYEFDVVIDMTQENTGVVSKTRCPELNGGVFDKPGEDVAGILLKWLNEGAPADEPSPAEVRETLRKDILRVADSMGYDAKKVDKWVNQKYEVTGGINDPSLREDDLRAIHKTFVDQSSGAKK